jgi:hypothetical protein
MQSRRKLYLVRKESTLNQATEKLTQVNDELKDLEHGDVLLPPNANSTGTLEVVPVHNDVHGQVQGDRNPRDSGQSNKLSPAQQSGGTMVVGVEESQRLLLQDEEEGVEEFKVLVEVVELHSQVSFAHKQTKRRWDLT